LRAYRFIKEKTKPLNAKENALRSIRFDRPAWVMQGLPAYALHYRGVNHEGYTGGGHDCPIGTRWKDIWGTGWQKEQEGVMGFPRVNPLAEVSALRTYRWPDPDDERICGQIYQQAAEFPHDDRFLAGNHRDTLWEKTYMLVGMENAMVYFHSEPGFMREVLHHIMDFQLGIARHYAALGVELVYMSDDLGTQRGPLLSPRIVREFIAPEYQRLFDFHKQRGVLVQFHSCGKVDAFLDMWMDLGVDILDPVQATANDLAAVRQATQGRMALHGAVSSALVMQGPAERIVAEARSRMWQLGREGGYFCAPDQGLPYPQGHLRALQEAVEQYGHYPLQPPA